MSSLDQSKISSFGPHVIEEELQISDNHFISGPRPIKTAYFRLQHRDNNIATYLFI